ncbi:Hypothetical predicted protein [Cloeon dipterum]|uniref:Uncharacterized protein n=1 Tax=Cloeon dipterum TaxID=197152 RepID=A0A8S1E3E2_9INSE|nr:Hypothetical predicted protein [Cloeon dipterum]
MANLRYLLIVFTIIVGLVSSSPKNKTNNLLKDHARNFATSGIDPYRSTQWTIDQNNEPLAKRYWVDMEKSFVYNVSEPSTIVQLPHKTNVFGHNVKRVEVMREGGIRSAEPNLQWDAIPLKIKTFDELTPCSIRYHFVHGNALAIQWDFGYHYCRNGVELSFQLKMLSSGKMFFIYKKIPYGSLQNAQCPDIANTFGVNYEFKVPGSDDTFDLGLQLTINETDIKKNTVILVKPLSMCANSHTHISCLTDKQHSCFWCPAIGVCSSNNDFLKNVWLQNGCGPITISYLDKGHLQTFMEACCHSIISVLLILICYRVAITLQIWFPLLRTNVISNSSSAVQQDEYDDDNNLSWPSRQSLFERPDSPQNSEYAREPPTQSSTPSSTPPPPYVEHGLAAHQLVDAEFVWVDPLAIRVNDQQPDLDGTSHVLMID